MGLTMTPGAQFQLIRPLEVRDEQTGTMKHYLLAGTVLTVRRVAPDEDRVWVEGVHLPLPLAALLKNIHTAG